MGVDGNGMIYKAGATRFKFNIDKSISQCEKGRENRKVVMIEFDKKKANEKRVSRERGGESNKLFQGTRRGSANTGYLTSLIDEQFLRH